MNQNIKVDPTSIKSKLLFQWEKEFNETLRKLSSLLLLFIPLIALVFVQFLLTPDQVIKIHLFHIYLICISASLIGLASFFFPWEKHHDNLFFIAALSANFFLCLLARETGYHHSPFYNLFFIIILLSAFYYRGYALYIALTFPALGYFISNDKNAMGFIFSPESIITFLSLIGIYLAAFFLDYKLKRYQRIACDSYEKLLQEKDKKYQTEQMQSIIETIGSLSHQLSQPLTTALGLIEVLLKQAEENKPHKEDLEKLKKQLLAAKNLLISFSKVGEYSTEEYVGKTKILKTDPKKQAPDSLEQNSSDE